jgi:hypothetical protein
MPVVRITGEGLAAVFLSVSILWGCFLAERLTMRNAVRERARVMYELRKLQLRVPEPQPASVPLPRPHAPRPAAG